jgi:ABC-type bacteriocin/lantibiotic exporter with double-glycine peptidase domain
MEALARAVYSRPEIIILDDVLSALDTKTEAHVAERLLGPNGLLRQLGTTVILITHAGKQTLLKGEKKNLSTPTGV